MVTMMSLLHCSPSSPWRRDSEVILTTSVKHTDIHNYLLSIFVRTQNKYLKHNLLNAVLKRNTETNINTNSIASIVYVPIVDIQDGCCRQNKQHKTSTAIYQQSYIAPTQ